MLKEKLVTPDLMKLKEQVKLSIGKKLNIGHVDMEGKYFYIELMTPSKMNPEDKYAALLKLKKHPKIFITIDEKDFKDVILNLIQSSFYSNNFILVENDYQVFVRPGVVLYLSLEEVAELVAIFYHLKDYIPESLKEGAYGL